MGGAGGSDQFRLRRARPGQPQIVRHTAVKEVWVLAYPAYLPPPALRVQVAQAGVAHGNRPRRRVEEAQQQVGDGALACAGGPGQGDGAAPADGQRDPG